MNERMIMRDRFLRLEVAVVQISVIVPVYNVEKYLAECLDSVLMQDFDDYEILCVEDKSQDRSREILQEYACRNERIRMILHDQNAGLSAARNSGLAVAQGKYILFVDSDDILAEGALRKLYTYAEEKTAEIVYFNYKRIYEEGFSGSPCRVDYKNYSGLYMGKEFMRDLLKYGTFEWAVWAQFYRRDFLEQQHLRFYNGILHEDMLFTFLCAVNANHVAALNDVLYMYRCRKGSIMQTKSNRRIESLLIVFKEIYSWWSQGDSSMTADENEAVTRYLRIVYSRIRYNMRFMNRGESAEMGGPAQKGLYQILTSDSYVYADLSADKIEQIRREERVLVYGAGAVAAEVLDALWENEIVPIAIVVTSRKNNPAFFKGIAVREIGELYEYKEAAVVVAVSGKFRDRVVGILKENGFQNIILGCEK